MAASVALGAAGVLLLLVSAFLDGEGAAYRWLRIAAWAAIALTCVAVVVAAARSGRRQAAPGGRRPVSSGRSRRPG